MAHLADDPDLQRKIADQEARLGVRAQEWAEAGQPILHDLAAGVPVTSVWDFVNTAAPYPAALPVLLEHLERGAYPDRVQEGLGRAPAVKPSVVFWNRLKAMYLESKDEGAVMGAAVALAACATRAQLDDLIGFLSNVDLSESRILFLDRVLKLGQDRGQAALEISRRDPVLSKEVDALLDRRT